LRLKNHFTLQFKNNKEKTQGLPLANIDLQNSYLQKHPNLKKKLPRKKYPKQINRRENNSSIKLSPRK